MLRTVGIRLLNLVSVLFVVSFGTSLLLQLVPGDPVIAALGDAATPESTSGRTTSWASTGACSSATATGSATR